MERIDFLAIEVQTNQSKFQITFNLIAAIAVVLVALFLIVRGLLRGTRKIIHRV